MIAIIDYGAGNVASVANAVADLDVDYKITDKEPVICNADKIIFPGVGEAKFAIRQLHMKNLINLLRIVKKPLLGICLGMQLLSEKSKEGNVLGLGIFPGSTEIFDKENVKVPHMGWNKVKPIKDSKLFNGIKEDEFFYFAHSYYLPKNEFTIATTNYDVEFACAIEKENYHGVQFHPEKSGEAGLKLLKNFCEM